MKKGNWSVYILLIVLAGPIIWFIFLKAGKYEYVPLPIYGERDVETVQLADGSSRTDTIYHTIPPFSFTDQYGRNVTHETFDSGIYVANFFFATCADVCPAMNSSLEKVATKLQKEPSVRFISHTVHPEHDSEEVLAAYAEKLHAKKDQWYFVTGSKSQLYELANRGYLISVKQGDAMPVSFIHDQKLILVDSKRRIRGMYDGLNSKEVEKMFEDIKMLLIQEYAPKPGAK